MECGVSCVALDGCNWFSGIVTDGFLMVVAVLSTKWVSQYALHGAGALPHSPVFC